MPQNRLMVLPDPQWVDLLRAEVAKPGQSIASVARAIAMPRPSLSMLLAGNYPARLDKVSTKYAAKVMQLYRSEVLCPHLRRGIAAAACLGFASAPMSTNNPDELQQWAACRGCPLNPVSKSEGVK